MKIAFLTWEYPPNVAGGAGIVAENIVSQLSQLDHKIFVFVPKLRNKYKLNNSITNKNIKIIKVPLFKFFKLKIISYAFNLNLWYLFFKVKYSGFDVVVSNGYVDFLLLKLFTNKSVRVAMVHHLCIDVRRLLKPKIIDFLRNMGNEENFAVAMEKIIIKKANYIFVESNFTKNRLKEEYNINDNKIFIFPCGFKCPNVKYLYFRKKKDKLNLLFVGRLEERKGLLFLINSLAIYKKIFKEEFILNIVGKGDNRKYKDVVKKLNLEEEITFQGYLSDEELNNYFRNSDIFIIPSQMEGFGLTILEAIQFGIPIIGTNRGAIPEILKDYNRGFLVNYGDCASLADTINSVYVERKNNTLENPNIEYFRGKYNWHETAAKMSQTLKNLINK
ncbi:MAG: glycosyltransferase family 4 protein [Candidatus Atribacteria bacterium]|nr:glycosyltransferase family 4 protein [Candidatus Atribacteria bacterium]